MNEQKIVNSHRSVVGPRLTSQYAVPQQPHYCRFLTTIMSIVMLVLLHEREGHNCRWTCHWKCFSTNGGEKCSSGSFYNCAGSKGQSGVYVLGACYIGQTRHGSLHHPRRRHMARTYNGVLCQPVTFPYTVGSSISPFHPLYTHRCFSDVLQSNKLI